MPGCPHRDGQRDAVDSDLERLLDRHLVALAVAEHGGDHPRRKRVGAAVGHVLPDGPGFGSRCWKPNRPLMQRLPRVMS